MMTNAQLYLVIGLPMISILIVWLGSALLNHSAIKGLSQRIDDLSQRIDDLGQRIDDLRSEMRAGFNTVNERIGRLEVRFDRIEDEVRRDHESRLSRLEARVFSHSA